MALALYRCFWNCCFNKFSKEQSLLACAFFAHPINSEVVLWISSRNDSIADSLHVVLCCRHCTTALVQYFCFLWQLIFQRKAQYCYLCGSLFVCWERFSTSKYMEFLSALIPWFFIRILLEIQPKHLMKVTYISFFIHFQPPSHMLPVLFCYLLTSAVRPLAWYTLIICRIGMSDSPYSLFLFHSEKVFWLGIVSYFPVFLPIALNGIYGDRYLYIPLLWFSIWVSSFDFTKYKWIYMILFMGFSIGLLKEF